MPSGLTKIEFWTRDVLEALPMDALRHASIPTTEPPDTESDSSMEYKEPDSYVFLTEESPAALAQRVQQRELLAFQRGFGRRSKRNDIK